jgi:hypothetical protein
VYSAPPPADPDQPRPRLRIGAMARQTFDGPPGIAARPGHEAHLRRYLSDLVRPYDLDLHPNGAGHSYGEMAAAVITDLVAPGQAVDLLVLAFAIPDVRPGRATATYLSHLVPGSPLAFAICDQGSAAGFTGLRLIGEYARTGACQRALLLVVEQSSLPYRTGLPVEVPAGHTAVGLSFDATGPIEVGPVYQYPDAGPERATALLIEALTAAAAGAGGGGSGPDEVIVVADAYLADRLTASAADLAGQIRQVPPGRPYTGAWWELAGVLDLGGRPAAPGPAPPEAAGSRRVVVACHDRHLRYLCLSIVDQVRSG